MRIRSLSLPLLCLALLASSAALAETLYKLIDKKGKVTYSEKPPKDFDGKVIRMNIDPNANTATFPKLPPPAPAEAKVEPEPTAAAKAPNAAQTARQNLERARRALQDAIDNPSESDFQFFANKGGGMRRVPTEAYTARLSALEQAVKAAEAEVEKLPEQR